MTHADLKEGVKLVCATCLRPIYAEPQVFSSADEFAFSILLDGPPPVPYYHWETKHNLEHKATPLTS